ncbi:glycine-rich protein [Clostridioides difficile]|nr:glycine-rich protein [Clostridioides difficile]
MATEWNFNYTGTEQNVILKPGKYRITCYGACGGALHYQSNTPKGGRVYGTLTLRKDTKLYVYVGQSGWYEADSTTTVDNRTGFNGGGKGAFASGSGKKYSLWGGGATDVRLIGGAWDNEQSLLSRIIVAGGGGSRTNASCTSGNGGGANGDNSQYNSSVNFSSGGTQFDGGRGLENKYSGTFGKGGDFHDSSTFRCGGGGGWFGGACGVEGSGGGSGYILTESSYKPIAYTPTSEYYFENYWYENGGANAYINGYCKIELLQSLPFFTVSSYNSTQATFKADHTDPTLLTKIEYFIDDVLKETITTDLTLEKTINYTLEDNALHTLKIVVTDSANATVEKVLSISKNIMPLPEENVNLNDISTKLVEVNAGFKTGKTSIVNTLALKNIEASLNNTLVELSEKIKAGFDSGDASLQDLMNQLTQANNTITQLNTQISALNSKYKYAYSTDVTLHWFVDCGFRPDFVIYHCWTKSTQLLTIATPDKYFSFMSSSRGWAIIQSDPNDGYSFSKNDTTRHFGTVFRENGFYCSNMPNDSLNDKYYFYYAIKCL